MIVKVSREFTREEVKTANKYFCIKKVQIKTILRPYLTLTRMAIIKEMANNVKDLGNGKPLFTVVYKLTQTL